jgi:phosphopantothenate-cysteine ligase
MRVLVTSGGTKIPIDTVRHIGNMSNGTFGSKIATWFLKNNCHVDFLCAKGSKTPFSSNIDLNSISPSEAVGALAKLCSLKESFGDSYHQYDYKTFDDYSKDLCNLIDVKFENTPDIVVLAAAVSDYGTKPIKGKIRSKDKDMSIHLHKLPKLIGRVKKKCPSAFLVGFKLLVDSTDTELIEAAKQSIKKNGCDMVIANDLRDIKNNDHKALVVYRDSDCLYDCFANSDGDVSKFVVDKILLEYENWKASK